MTDTDRQLPDEPPNDDYHWTAEPEEPDIAGMPGEFTNEPDDAVPRLHSGERSTRRDASFDY